MGQRAETFRPEIGKGLFPRHGYPGSRGGSDLMGKRLEDHEIASFNRQGTFEDAGRALREGFATSLLAPNDATIEEYLRILSETSPHDMGSC